MSDLDGTGLLHAIVSFPLPASVLRLLSLLLSTLGNRRMEPSSADGQGSSASLATNLCSRSPEGSSHFVIAGYGQGNLNA
jgi:hypothetical protein